MIQEQEERENSERKIVVDASAIIAFIYNEPGADKVLQFISSASISSVNLSEVVTDVLKRGADIIETREHLSQLPLEIIPFNAELAYEAAALEKYRKSHNLSFGDRACLSTGLRLNSKIVTADTKWATLPLSLDIEVIR